MKLQPSRAEILQVAHVFGLGGDMVGNPDRSDGIDKLVFQCKDSVAFVTLTEHLPYQPLGCLYTLGKSKIAFHNATTEPAPLTDWEKQIPINVTKRSTLESQIKAIRDVAYCRYYDLHDATFATTELEGIPERIFLFVTAPNFDMELVISLLCTYRTLNPLPEVTQLTQWFNAEG